MKKVLLVEDEVQIRRLLKQGLEGFCEVAEVSSGKEVIPTFEEVSPDAVLSDYDLGDGRTGDEFFEFYKKQNPKIIIIMMSGKGNIGEELIGKGAHDFLAKSFTIQALIEVFKKHALLPLRPDAK